MDDHTDNTNENTQSNTNIIDDSALLNTEIVLLQQISEDDVKISEPVAEDSKTIVSEGKLTVRRIFRAVENTDSSDSNLHDRTPTIMGRSLIVEMDSLSTGNDVQPCPSPSLPTNPSQSQSQSQISIITTDKRHQQLDTRRHVMISYNRATATAVCQRMYDRLTEENYRVWFDRTNLTYGSIIDAMGEAVDDAYVVLLCINEGYSKSEYCLKEAKYAVESKVPIIPCMMEDKFRPRGGLGIIKSDLKHIEFFDDDKFDESFAELTSEIDAIEAGSTMNSVPVDNNNFRERFDTILTEYMRSIQNCHLGQRNLDETELWTLLRRFIQEFSPETWQSFQNDSSNDPGNRQTPERDNDRLIQQLLINNERIVELARLQQENHVWIQQHLLDQDERLAAFHHFQQRQEQEHARSNHNERLMAFRVEEEDVQRRKEEGNDRIVRQLEQQIQQLTELVKNEREQHARDMEAMHRLVHRSLDASSNTQQQPTSYFDRDLLKNVIQTTVLLCTLLVLFKNR